MTRIGIDIDETIAASFHGLFEYCKAKKWVVADWEDFTEFDICKIPAFNITKEEETALWREFFLKNHDTIKVIEGSKEWLEFLQKHNYSFSAITGRIESHDKKMTEDWIEKHFPDFFESIHYSNHATKNHIPKSEICKQLGITIMVDDSFDFALDLANAGITTIVLEKPWNKHHKEAHSHIIRAKHWNEIPNIILNHGK